MSLASNQSITILAFINASFITMQGCQEVLPTVEYAKETCKRVISKFPETGNPQKNFNRMAMWMREINKVLPERKGLYTTVILAYIAEFLVVDLMERIKDKKKLEMLEEIAEVCVGLGSQIDPEGKQLLAMEKAEELSGTIKKIIGW